MHAAQGTSTRPRPTHNSHARVDAMTIHHPDWMGRHPTHGTLGPRSRVGRGWLTTRLQSTTPSVPAPHFDHFFIFFSFFDFLICDHFLNFLFKKYILWSFSKCSSVFCFCIFLFFEHFLFFIIFFGKERRGIFKMFFLCFGFFFFIFCF